MKSVDFENFIGRKDILFIIEANLSPSCNCFKGIDLVLQDIDSNYELIILKPKSNSTEKN